MQIVCERRGTSPFFLFAGENVIAHHSRRQLALKPDTRPRGEATKLRWREGVKYGARKGDRG